MALDFLAIALTNLATISERRIDRLVNPDLNQGLPPFLTRDAGVNSGFMMAQVTAASLASECKVLSHPASVDTIPTDGNKEDVVPMAMARGVEAAARRAQRAVRARDRADVCGAGASTTARRSSRGAAWRARTPRCAELVAPLERDRVLSRRHRAARARDRRRRMCFFTDGQLMSAIDIAGRRRRDAHGPRVVRAPRGSALSCKGWQQEAALRMLMNNLDPDVAERPDDLVVYGGTGKAARSWEAFDAIVDALRTLENDETLLVQSGKPVGVFRTHASAPRVLIANCNLVGRWANWDYFRELERARPDDVRPDDRRLVDLHRLAGHPAGHVRDVRRRRAHALRRNARRPLRAHGGPRRHGRRAAARRDDERRGDPRHRRRRVAHRQAPRDGLLRPRRRAVSTKRSPGFARRRARATRALGRARRQRGAEVLAGAGAPRRARRTCSPIRRARTTR